MAALGGRFGLERETALRLGRALGGGMGRGLVCGAVSAGLLVLGLMGQEPSEPDDKAPRRQVMIRGQRFLDAFARRRGSIVCNDLLGLDLATPEGHATAVEQELFTTRCPVFVEASAGLLEEMATARTDS